MVVACDDMGWCQEVVVIGGGRGGWSVEMVVGGGELWCQEVVTRFCGVGWL